MKMTMLREAGYTRPVAVAYTDSSADLPLLQAAQRPVVVNPKAGRAPVARPGGAGDAVAPSIWSFQAPSSFTKRTELSL